MNRIRMVVLCATIAVATPVPAGSFTLGGAVEIGASSLVGNPSGGGRYRAGVSPGAVLFLDARIAHGVTLSFQPGYSRTSTALRFRRGVTGTNYEIDSIEIPVMLRVYANDKRYRPYVLGGFGVGLPVRAAAEDLLGKESVLDDLATANLLARFAAGMRFPLWSHALLAEARYTQAITNITKSDDLAGEERFKATSLKLWIGYAFDL